MRIDYDRLVTRLILLLCAAGMCFLLFGCAGRVDGTKRINAIEKTTTAVPVTAPDGTVTMQPVTTLRELWQDEKSHEKSTSGPDVERIAAAVEPVAKVVAGSTGLGGANGLLATGATLATGVLAWLARGRETKSKDDQIRERDERLERLRADRDNHQKRAESYARQLPPETKA